MSQTLRKLHLWASLLFLCGQAGKFIVQFQKMSIPNPRKVNGNSKGEGVSKYQFFKGKYDAKIEFPAGIGGSS